MRRFSRIGLVLCAAVVLAGASSLRTDPLSPRDSSSPGTKDPNGVVVHEWGTFTSVAGPDGSAVEWIPQQGPSDLPCFVNRARLEPKSWTRARVRMETPVLYFYSSQNATVDVRVRFRQGVMTEWFPHADVTPTHIKAEMLRTPDFAGEISWKQLQVLPAAEQDFQTDSTRNHYYAARATDASPVQVGSEREKFLFYRGIANFEPPLRATLQGDGRIAVGSRADEAIGEVVLFENLGGATAHLRVHIDDTRAVLSAPAATRGSKSVTEELEGLLVAHGLYGREARAMVDTWKDSWFEEGTRLFYIVSPRTVDDVLPLDITPAPSAIARVFVGRLEILTARTIDDVKGSLARRDRVGILRHRRFLEPIMARVHPTVGDASRADWQFIYDTARPRGQACR
jgi:hypothetical protein